MALLTLTHVELDVEVLDLSEGFSQFDLQLFVLAIVSRHGEFFSLTIPTLVALLFTIEDLLKQLLLPLILHHISTVNIQCFVESIEFNPYLLLEHFRGFLRSGEKLLFDIYFILCRLILDVLSSEFRCGVDISYLIVHDDYLEDFVISVFLVEEENLHAFEGELEFLCWVVEELLVVLFD